MTKLEQLRADLQESEDDQYIMVKLKDLEALLDIVDAVREKLEDINLCNDPDWDEMYWYIDQLEGRGDDN